MNFYNGRLTISAVPFFILLISPFSLHDIGWLFDRYICGVNTVDFAVKSISYYKETDLNTNASTFFTQVVVTSSGWTRPDSNNVSAPIDLRLAFEDGTVIDTSWSETGDNIPIRQTFTFKTKSAPVYAQLNPWNKITDDFNYANNSLMVHDFLRPVVKWADRIFDFFQNALLSTGVLV